MVMSENKKEDQLLESYYDGIEEYDNDLPRWWLWLFYITIIIAPIYVGYYHFGPGLQPSEELAVDMKELEEIRSQYAAKMQGGAPMTEESLLALVSDLSRVERGAKVYAEKCMVCHGTKGEGLVGPNLTDAQWIHGGKVTEIKTVIEVGVPAKGMLAWKELLPADQISDVLSFVWSIRNTNVPGKAPEGPPAA
jgi:cytochrome c oxidase cbb3-type subunit 3